MPGSDKPTGRVVALIVLLVLVAAALRGYFPAPDHSPRKDSGSSPAALVFVIAALVGTFTLLTVAIVARLRDPRAAAPNAADLPEMPGGGADRPSWRTLLIGFGVIVGLLVLMVMLNELVATHHITTPAPGPDTSAPPSTHAAGGPAPRRHRQSNTGSMFGVVLACTAPLLLILVAATFLEVRRRWRAATSRVAVAEYREPAAPERRSESLVRAAELGLAEMTDLGREPREAIIACYAAMEHELANVPGAIPQDFDTPTEVLARAVEHRALQPGNAIQLVDLFGEARFSPHVMNESHRDVAVRLLRLVVGELRSMSHA